MTLTPEIPGILIETDHKEGFKSSSLLFVFLSLIASILGLMVMKTAKDTSFRYGETSEE